MSMDSNSAGEPGVTRCSESTTGSRPFASINTTLTERVTAPPVVVEPSPAIVDRVSYELHPVLAGLSLLTNAMRVLQAVEDHSSTSESFGAAMREACPTWVDPLCRSGEESHGAVVADLARYALDLCTEILVADLDRGAA